jgi:hypothetical protein
MPLVIEGGFCSRRPVLETLLVPQPKTQPIAKSSPLKADT